MPRTRKTALDQNDESFDVDTIIEQVDIGNDTVENKWKSGRVSYSKGHPSKSKSTGTPAEPNDEDLYARLIQWTKDFTSVASVELSDLLGDEGFITLCAPRWVWEQFFTLAKAAKRKQ